MKTAKSSITRLKTSIMQQLPNTPDIYGFEGISRSILTDCLDETYGLLEGLTEKKETFEVIFLKRKLASLTSDCNDYLKDSLKEFSKEKKFNKFLEDIFAIRTAVKETYFLIDSNALRDESALLRIRQELENYRTELESYLEYKNEIDAAHETITTLKKELAAFHSKYDESNEHVSTVVSNIDDASEKIEEYKKTAADEVQSILETRASIIKNKVAYQGSVGRFNNLISELKEQQAKIQDQTENIDTIQERIKTQQDSIQLIIDDANRASMAGSFLKRKNELESPIKWSSRIMNGSLMIAAGISALLLDSSGLFEGTFDYISFLFKIPVIAPFIWIAWSNSQRNNYLVRIQEDYAFKYASAMAFEGYRKQAQETDESLERLLLKLSIDNMGMNPIRLFDKPVKSSPLNEIIQGGNEAINSLRGVASSTPSKTE
ncbi:TPA: coiled-coil domain-containing protein [Vibrio cholerae]|uniref:coiled-coil domain-containing protein n=1 Tax=Vibrio cholerae TaxID=666 RepID=UPI001B81780F|nr:hypothetical protein [Vibrio cholerae]MCD1243385.1 hypothetical protein [Vibrio cholerae]HBC3477206.1 hypothetical protein [Vibrio cholerae]HDZ9144695.1 hypothetical protein [Vibrio cholerae]